MGHALVSLRMLRQVRKIGSVVLVAMELAASTI